MLPIAPDAWPYLRNLAVAAALFALFGWGGLVWITLACGGFIAFFFRDPHRTPPPDRSLLVAPADGRVMRVESVGEDPFVGGPAVKIAIFLSVFDVHINRSPLTGEVRTLEYRAGRMLPAFRPHASELNERNTLGIEGQGVRVVVHQITGMLARRIVCRVAPGDRLRRGQRFGLIKLGSCTELVVPEAVEILVAPGDRVRGGETPVARLPE